jgi:hypothetical protein
MRQAPGVEDPMSRPRVEILLAIALVATFGKAPLARGVESNGFVQDNISTAKITANGNRYLVDIAMLATDVEQMFFKTGREREEGDLNRPGALEREIGKLIVARVTMRDGRGADCVKKVEKAGEDPSNDEGVLVELSFDCASTDASYDASKLLTTQSPRAWQVVTVMRGGARRQVMVNGESPPVPLAEAR